MKRAAVFAAGFALCTAHGIDAKDCATYLETTASVASGTCMAGLALKEADQNAYCARRLHCQVELTAVITYVDGGNLDLFACSAGKPAS